MSSATDTEPVCGGCFLECRRESGSRPYPCSDELRKWATENRDAPDGYVLEKVGGADDAD